MPNYSWSYGYALMELVVGFAVMSLLVLGTLYTLHPWLMQPKFYRVAYELRDHLYRARTYAVIHQCSVVVCPVRHGHCCQDRDWHDVGVFVGRHLYRLYRVPWMMHLFWLGRFHHRMRILFLGRGGLDGQQGHFELRAWGQRFAQGLYVAQSGRLSLNYLNERDHRWIRSRHLRSW
jgi:hypothetical protein